MKKLKKALAAILSLMMCLTFIQVPINVDATENSDLAIKASEAVYVKIRYNIPDNNYDGWNLWVWEAGKDGKRVDFIGEDSKLSLLSNLQLSLHTDSIKKPLFTMKFLTYSLILKWSRIIY